MTYRELYEKATRQLEHSEMTLGEYEKMTKPLDEEVRKNGKWAGEEEGYYSECSCCGASFLWEDYKYLGDWKYCPKCGARMERGENG